jgi:hypothetical protein
MPLTQTPAVYSASGLYSGGGRKYGDSVWWGNRKSGEKAGVLLAGNTCYSFLSDSHTKL